MKEKIGEAAVLYKFITKEQLLKAQDKLAASREAGRIMSIQEILVEEDYLSKSQLELIYTVNQFMEQKALDKKFADIAIQRGVISSEDAEKAFNIQLAAFKKSKIHRKLGDILVESAMITPEQRDSVFEFQDNEREEKPVVPEPSKESASENVIDVKDDNLRLQMIVSGDFLSAYIKCTDKTLPESATVEKIRNAIEQHGIRYGVVDDVSIAKYIHEKSLHASRYKIAQGIAPKPSRGGKIDYYFDTDYLKPGTLLKDGKMDYMNRGVIPIVKEGDLLAQKTPFSAGGDGLDVFGKPIILAEKGEVDLISGEGTSISADRTMVYAKIDGQPILASDGTISVSPNVEIKGDVCLKTGHINFEGDVNVAGSIQDDFAVTCRNLTAREILKARVDVTGDISVSGGIIESNIRARGGIESVYITRSYIESENDIHVKNEIIESTIKTGGAVELPSGNILSSKISAKKGIRALNIGSEVTTPNTLRVGINYTLETKINKLNQSIELKTDSLEEIRKRISQMNKKHEDINRHIDELNPVREYALDGLKTIEEKITAMEMEDAENEALGNARKVLKTLNDRIRETDRFLNDYYKSQGIIIRKIKDTMANLKSVEGEIQDLNQKKEELVNQDSEDRGIPEVVVQGAIMEKTKIYGIHSKTILKSTYKNLEIRETNIADKTSVPAWEMQLFF